MDPPPAPNLAVHSLQHVLLVRVLVHGEINGTVTTLSNLLLQLDHAVAHLQSAQNLGLRSLAGSGRRRSGGRRHRSRLLSGNHFSQSLHPFSHNQAINAVKSNLRSVRAADWMNHIFPEWQNLGIPTGTESPFFAANNAVHMSQSPRFDGTLPGVFSAHSHNRQRCSCLCFRLTYRRTGTTTWFLRSRRGTS